MDNCEIIASLERVFHKQGHLGVIEESIKTNEEAYGKGIDLVHVVILNGLQAVYSITIARAGKHVLCEKLMMIRSEDCKKMIDEFGKAGVLLGDNYRLHWEPHHLKMIELAGLRTYGEGKYSIEIGNIDKLI